MGATVRRIFSPAEVTVFADRDGVRWSAIFADPIGRLQTFCRPFFQRHIAPVHCWHGFPSGGAILMRIRMYTRGQKRRDRGDRYQAH